jgi:RND family efflux transporter MFP subunit
MRRSGARWAAIPFVRGDVVMPLKSAAIAAVLMGAAACHSQTPPTREAAAPVEAGVATVEQVEWPAAFEAGGVVRAELTANVAARILAPVVAVHVNAGDRVRRGQPLVTLDSRELRANADRAAASLAAARESAAAATAHQAAAEAALGLARATHDRMHRLHATRSATAQELDTAVAGLTGAAATLDAARAQAAAAAASLDVARAAAEGAQVGLSYTVLTAPFDGVVATRSVDPGALAAPGVELLMVESASGRRLEVQVDESRRNLVAPGGEAEIRLDAGADGAWTKTRIAEIARLDPRQHSFLVKLDVPEQPGVHPGAFGRARFFGPARRTLAAPASAVVRRGQLWFAFAVDRNGLARLRVLTPGDVRADRVEVLAGLQAGERVVLDPPPSMEDGARVRARSDIASRQSPQGATR